MTQTLAEESPWLLTELSDGIARVTVNRPRVRNAFTMDMWRALHRFADAVRNDSGASVLIIQGAGDEAFSAGSDIRELAGMGLDSVDVNLRVIEDALSAVESLPIPTVACLNGPALGGGLELALACDLRVASERTVLGMPIARLGIIISPRFAKRLVDLIGPSRTRDLLYTGRLVNAGEALAMGLVDRCVPPQDLQETVWAMSRRIADQSSPSVRAAKRMVAFCLSSLETQGSTEANCIDRDDFAEGVAAFLEKRAPRFQRSQRQEGD